MYYDGKNVQTCRITNASISISSYDSFQKFMSDANPEKYLSNKSITYPTSGQSDHVVHVSKFEEISDQLITDDSWSDEYKVFLFARYIRNNYAYDTYRQNKNMLNMKSRATKAGIYNDDNYYTYGNHVGVCWDFTNIMTIMCRHHGIPATSVEGSAHTAPAIWLNDEWTVIDVTEYLKYECRTENTDSSSWIKYSKGSGHGCYGCYDLGSGVPDSHDNEIWTYKRATTPQ